MNPIVDAKTDANRFHVDAIRFRAHFTRMNVFNYARSLCIRGVEPLWTKLQSTEYSELSKIPSFKPGAGQNIAFCTSLTARNSAFLQFYLPDSFIFVFKVLFENKLPCAQKCMNKALTCDWINFVSARRDLRG